MTQVHRPSDRVRIPWGASINDVHKIFGFFDPLPPCSHLDVINTIIFTQPPLICPLFRDPSAPPTRTSHLDAPLSFGWSMLLKEPGIVRPILTLVDSD